MTFDKIKDIIVETINLDEDQITLEAKIQDDLDIDSLDAMEICLAIEEGFEISIPQEAIEKFVTIGDIVAFVDQQVA